MTSGTLRLAAAADVHARAGDEARVKTLFGGVEAHADALIIAGDLTDHGRADEVEALLRGLDGVGVPVFAVLGNHDHEQGDSEDVSRMLEAAGIHVLERAPASLDGGRVGIAGAKGFGGGFGERIVNGFGEDATKAFVAESVVQAEALRAGLRAIDAPTKVAVTHYAPILDTVRGEPPEIHAFLGTTRLAAAIDEGGATLAFHGHAHHGAPDGATKRGALVHNVSLPVIRAAGEARGYRVFEI